jgi:hypothetical protein
MSANLPAVKTFKAAIKVLGGTAAAARALKTRDTQICHWRVRKNAFPADLYFQVQAALEQRGYRAEATAFTFELDW